MAIGGFDGEGGNITLSQFKAYVAKGEIHYYIASGAGGGFPGRGGSSTSITSWVESHFTKVTIGGETLYDLTASSSPSRLEHDRRDGGLTPRGGCPAAAARSQAETYPEAAPALAASATRRARAAKSGLCQTIWPSGNVSLPRLRATSPDPCG